MVGADGREAREDREIERQDLGVTTANKQLNFLQHIATIRAMNGRAAVVLPTTCSSRAARARPSAASCCATTTCTPCSGCPPGSSTRRASRRRCSSSTSARPPNTRGPSGCGCTTCVPTSASRSSRTRSVARTSTTSSRRSAPDAGPSGWRASASDRSSFSYEELVARDKANLDITWLKDASLEDVDDLPAPEVIAREIVDDLTAAPAGFEAVAAALERTGAADPA
jgi:type I restriction enzyme M protein